jgi:polar amino acid transport system substrate-binding protein
MPVRTISDRSQKQLQILQVARYFSSASWLFFSIYITKYTTEYTSCLGISELDKIMVTKLLSTIILTTLVFLGPGPRVSADPVKLTYNSEWPPYSIGAGNKVSGILPDLLHHLINDRMGLPTEHSGYPWKRVQRSVETGKQDALITVPTDKRLTWSYSSKSVVYSVEMKAVVKRGSAAEKALMSNTDAAALAKFNVCDILGNGWGSKFLMTHKIPYQTASNVGRCLDMISRGRMDVSVQSVAVAGQNIRDTKLDGDLVILPQTYGSMDFTLLVSKKKPGAREFLAKFDQVVGGMQADGSLQELVGKLRSK